METTTLKRMKVGKRLTLTDLVSRNEIEGKRVLMRVDFNVPLDKTTGEISNDQRIRGALPTIKFALEEGKAKAVVLMSHLGRPSGQIKESLSLKKVAVRLQELLERPVTFLSDCVGEEVTNQCADPPPGSVFLLELFLKYCTDCRQNGRRRH